MITKCACKSTVKRFRFIRPYGSRRYGDVSYFQQIEPKEFLTWEIGYVFNPAFGGKGYATEACARILKYAFEEAGAHRVIGRCNPENAASWRLMERLSMRREGYYKKPAFFRKTPDGKPSWFDAYEYSILEEEYFARGAHITGSSS